MKRNHRNQRNHLVAQIIIKNKKKIKIKSNKKIEVQVKKKQHLV